MEFQNLWMRILQNQLSISYIYIYKLYCETKTFCEGKYGGKGKMTNCKILMVKHNYNLYLSVVFKGNCPVLVLNEKTKI